MGGACLNSAPSLLSPLLYLPASLACFLRPTALAWRHTSGRGTAGRYYTRVRHMAGATRPDRV